MSFRDLNVARLGKYKTDVLNVQEDGTFRYRGREIPQSHILPKDKEAHNILEPYRQRFLLPDYRSVQRHQYFHHLNSSQALCVNLFLPLREENKLGAFLDYLEIPTTGNLHSEFEKKSLVEEKAARKTSFDFYLKNSSNEVYVEVKYTEDGFGKAKNDDVHHRKFTLTYQPLLKASRYLAKACQDEAEFLGHYQMLRNLVHIGDKACVVLLFPSGNEQVAIEAAYAKKHFLTDVGRERLVIVHLERLISHLETALSGTPLDYYYQRFREKYLQ